MLARVFIAMAWFEYKILCNYGVNDIDCEAGI
jgi:hypothetical protein